MLRGEEPGVTGDGRRWRIENERQEGEEVGGKKVEEEELVGGEMDDSRARRGGGGDRANEGVVGVWT